MAPPVSPLAVPLPELPPLAGVRLGAAQAGIRYQGRTDLVMVELRRARTVAGVFTRNHCPGAPVDWCRAALRRRHGRARWWSMPATPTSSPAGPAREAVRGDRGGRRRRCSAARRSEVFLASTGVIGEVLPHERLTAALPGAARDARRRTRWEAAARGIMTTDTFPKARTRTGRDRRRRGADHRHRQGQRHDRARHGDHAVLRVHRRQAAGRAAAGRCWSAGSSAASTAPRSTATPRPATRCCCSRPGRPARPDRQRDGSNGAAPRSATALDEVLLDLALQVVRDGEGAQKLIRIDVTGAVSAKSAHRVAMAIANSPLVKTAIAGEDANWGRIVMAVGKAGEPADRDRLSVGVGGTWMARDGGVVPGYDEAPVVAHMKGREIEIAVDLGLGRGRATAWTCDLTHGYIDINGSYRS